MKKIVAVLASIILVFSAVNASAATGSVSAENSKVVSDISNQYKQGQTLSLSDSLKLHSIFNVPTTRQPVMKASGFGVPVVQNYLVQKQANITNPGRFTFALSGTIGDSWSGPDHNFNYDLKFMSGAFAGSQFQKPKSITLIATDYMFVLATIPVWFIKSTEVQKSAVCYNTDVCRLTGSASYRDFAIYGYPTAEIIIEYPNITYSYFADLVPYLKK